MGFSSLLSIKFFIIVSALLAYTFNANAKEKNLVQLDKACKKDNFKACDKIVKIQKRQAQKEISIQASLENRINCIRNNAEACFNEAFDNDSLGNIKEANKFYEKACSLKLASGCNNRAYHAKKAKQIAIAKEFYLKACDLGEMKACSAIGSIEIRNDDLHEAYKYFAKACDGKAVHGCYNMGWVQAQWQNFKLANHYYQMACKQKFKDACENIEVIADRLQESLAKDYGPEKELNKDVECTKILNADFLPLATNSANSAYGANVSVAVNAAITKVNYSIFNQKKECGAKNIRLPASHRLPYTGVEDKY